MAHLYPDTRSLLEILTSRVLQEGPMPQHVAIIMDGNRRYAKSKGLQRILGHESGLLKAKELARWGYELKIPELTLYVFSIENFNRPQDQVDELMQLLDDYCSEMVNSLKSAVQFDCCIQFVGNWDLTPAKIKPDMARIMMETRHCKTLKINLAFAYTGRNGIERSMKSIEHGLKDGQLLSEDVSEYLVDEAQNLVPMRPVDILIRTGGDSRISDFMMWESTDAYMHFIDTAWPDMTFMEVADAILKYQMHRRTMDKPPPSRDALTIEQNERMDTFLEKIREKKWSTLKRFAEKSNRPDVDLQEYEDTLFRGMVKKLLAFT